MIGLLCFLLAVLGSPFKSKIRLEAENAVLRHQLIVLRRKMCGRVQLANGDRWFLVRPICAESCDPMLVTTTTSEHIGHWIKMRRPLARFSGLESSIHARYSADFIIITSGFRFSIHTTV